MKNLTNADNNNSLVWTCDIWYWTIQSRLNTYNWFNPATYLCLSQTTNWISKSICCLFYCSIVWGGCSFCWYWWNWPSLFKFLFVRKVWRYQREVIIICKSKDRQYNGQKKKDKRSRRTIYKTLHRKLKIQQHEPH